MFRLFGNGDTSAEKVFELSCTLDLLLNMIQFQNVVLLFIIVFPVCTFICAQ